MRHVNATKKMSQIFGPFFKTSLLGFILSTLAFTNASAEELKVPIDETKAFVLEQAVATVAVTNPAVADVSVHNDKVVLVVGRSFGTTNIIALNADGVPVATKRIRVVSPGGSANVTYVRGPGIFSYSCAPRCERVLMPGDRTNLPSPDIGPATFRETADSANLRDERAKSSSE
jgi:putative type II/III system pilus formation protein